MSKKQMPGVDSHAERATFARNFRKARMELRLRQRDVHLITGIAQSRISEIEAGTHNIALDTMVKLATAVKTPLWQLFKPEDEGSDDDGDDEAAHPRHAPRSKQWHVENFSQVAFEFSADEMRRLRSQASKAGITVTELVRNVLCKAEILPEPETVRPAPDKPAKK